MIIALIAIELAFTALIAIKFAAVKLAVCVLSVVTVGVKLGVVSEPLTEPVNLINFTACMVQEFSLATFVRATSGFCDAKFKAPSDLGAVLSR